MRLSPHLLLGALHATSGWALLAPLIYRDHHGTPHAVHNRTTYTLSSNSTAPSVLILDYGRNVEGYGTFQVSRRSGDTSVFEMSYSETEALLDTYMADGPVPLAAAMDTYRINRYNITEEKTYTNRLIQGALRYQKLNLSSAGELELSFVGFKPAVHEVPLSQLPGSFHCSDPVLNRIWETGARTVQLNEFPARSLPDFWVITDEGARVDSLAPQPFAADFAATMTAYKVGFSVKPVMRGFGLTVLSDTLGNGVYIFVDVANSSISAHAGSTEIGSPPLASAVLPPTVALNQWHTVEATVNVTQIIIKIDGGPVLDFSQTAAFYGSFGLGASFGHTAVFANVSLTAFGTQMYSSSLTDKSALKDFLLGTNPLPVSVDGSRRDRIAYAGDLDITARTAFASTNGLEYINGSIALLGSMQMLPGFFTPTAKVQQAPRKEPIQANITGLIGYSFSLVSSMAQYYEQTGDVSFLRHWPPRVSRLFDWADSQTLPNGLLNISDATFGGDWNYYDPPLSGVVSKFNLVYAYALKQWLPHMADGGLNATLYTNRLHSLQKAIATHLWSDKLQAFYLSDAQKDFFSQEANALAILSDTAPVAGNWSARTILATMARDLYIPAGALAFSNASAASGWAQKISPYASGYHLQAAFHANDHANAAHLLRSVWGPMSDPSHANYTGCTWETLDADGTPGLGASTSLCHAWGSAPTAALSRYVLGVKAVRPGFREWKVDPQTLGLEYVRGRHPVPQGSIQVEWSFGRDGLLKMSVIAPAGTKGTVVPPSPLKVPLSKYRVSGHVKEVGGGFVVQGGQAFTLQQSR
ncbi:Six-hairpin glycosidase-like protein [Aspergillus floccosus]